MSPKSQSPYPWQGPASAAGLRASIFLNTITNFLILFKLSLQSTISLFFHGQFAHSHFSPPGHGWPPVWQKLGNFQGYSRVPVTPSLRLMGVEEVPPLQAGALSRYLNPHHKSRPRTEDALRMTTRLRSCQKISIPGASFESTTSSVSLPSTLSPQ